MSDRPSLLHCMLSFAKVVIAGVAASALVAGMYSEAWAVDLLGAPGAGGSASATAAAAAQAAAQSQAAQQAAQHSIDMLGRTSQAIQNMRSAQDAARALAAQAPTYVPNGLTPGGLVVDPRVGAANDSTNLWVNAKLPTQASGSDGKTTVTIEQQAQRALLTWQEFNVGRDTTVYFDQRGGNSANGNNWIALNRIDATGVPSQILGQIKAEGTVVLINPNGVIFNGTSQINVHSLIAAAMDLNSFTGTANGAFKASGDAYVPIIVGGLTQTGILAPSDEANANKTFLANGLFINSSFQTTVNGNTVNTGATAVFSAGPVPGQSNAGILVEAGARITTDVSGFDNGGFVALLGPQVTNAGSIETSAGSIILAAGANAIIGEPPATTTSQTADKILNRYAVRTNLEGWSVGSTNQSFLYTPSPVSGVATATNAGLVVSKRGNITLFGDAVAQNGIAEATTSITRAGSITIAAYGALFGQGSLTTILPEENGETIPSDAESIANFVRPRIDVGAPNVDFAAGSLVYAPSAEMVVAGLGLGTQSDGSAQYPSGRVLMEAGSTIDLSGLTAYRSVADYIFTFKVTGNDVADTPLAQSLIGETVTVDLSQTGTRADGETWVGSPLFASSGAGYLANVVQSIDQLLTKGGTLSFNPGYSIANGQTTPAFTDVLQAPGSVVNISGGTIQYTGAAIATTQLLGSDGRTYDIATADPFVAYQGFAGTYTVDHSHWGQKEVYANHLYSGSYYKAGYTNGLSAGGLNVTAVNPILEGNLVGDIVIGAQQRQLAATAKGTDGKPVQLTPDQLPLGASLSITLAGAPGGANVGLTRNAVILDDKAPGYLGSGTSMASALTFPTNADGVPVLTISTDRLSGYNLGSITISGADTLAMTQDADLAVRDGGSITLAGAATIDGTLTAHGGNITISGTTTSTTSAYNHGYLPSLVIGSHALLDVSGRWVNDTGHYGEDFAGALYIDGGSVKLSTSIFSKVLSYDASTRIVTAEDRSPSLLLLEGSVIDVSSGGYVGTSGKLAYGDGGLPTGKGGNVSLSTYTGSWRGSTNVGSYAYNPGYLDFAPQAANAANLVMDGTIYAGGLSQGGTFTLQAPAISIDGNATEVTAVTSGAARGTVVLPPSFFTRGFSSYALTSTYGDTTVAAGTTLTLKQQNYLAASMVSLPETGARVREFAALGYAPDGMRRAVDLALTQTQFISSVRGGVSDMARLLIDEGASILADPRANITLTAGGPAIVLGRITAHGGSITINEGFDSGLSQFGDALPQYTWIGEHAVLDVSGTFVPKPLVTAYATGTVLPGGSITFATVNSSGATVTPGNVIALQGSVIDISGASATIEIPTGAGLGDPLTTTRQVWSNGGTLAASGYLGGTIKANGGAPQAAGGTLVTGTSTGSVVVTQSGNVAAAFAGAPLPTTRSGLAALVPASGANITADTINASGLDTVSFAGPLYFSGDVNLKVPGSLLIDIANNAITLLPTGVTSTSYTAPACTPVASCIPSIGGANVTLEAGYIRFANSSTATAGASNLPKLADGTLTLKAREQIDLSGVLAVNNAGTVNLVSGGDIRLIGTRNFGASPSGLIENVSDGYGGMPWAGGLLVADNLNLTARTIYPATDTAYLLMSRSLAPAGASGTHNTITIASNGEAPVAPLSAGGAIVVDAKTIVQGGALYAPLGTIQLGLGAGQTLPSIFINGTTNNPYNPVRSTGFTGLYTNLITTVSTDSVKLLPGSVTSVSANGLLIPYGTTTDGTDWTDNNTLLNGPPGKLIALGGSNIDTQAGAIIDGSGGGDVYATEFVPGTGGSRNVLTTTTQTIYALVPGYSSGMAPYDPSFTTKVAAGTTVTLPGGNGIAGGTYTLLPAEYATLPGAYRVVVTNTNASPYAQTFTAPDGSVYMTGVLGNAINGSSSSQTALLQIQSNSVWTQYSQIDIAKGSTYFTALASTNATAVPRLAQDAARLVVAAATSLALDADNRFDPAAGGLGGQLDITGTNLVVAASDKLASFGTLANGVFTPSSAYAGYLVLDADMLSGLGIESTLIGGYRSNTSEGTLITATALNLEIATDTDHPLTGPEVLLTSLAPTSANPNVRGLVVDDGSVVTAKGAVTGGSSSTLVVGVDPVAQYNSSGTLTGYAAGVSGDGSLLRVSNGGLVNITRHFVPGVYQAPATTPTATPPVSSFALGSLAIGNNVALTGNTLTLDTSGDSTVSASARLAAKNYDLSGRVINLGGGSGGLVVTPDFIDRFAGADAVRLRSGSVFNLYGSNSFGDGSNRIGTLTLDGAGLYSDGGATTITAGNIVLANSQATANTNGANTSGSGGSLVLDASGALTFGKGAKTLSGFANVTATAGTEALFTGNGSLDAKGANVTLTAPLVLADKAASQSLKTTGLLSLAQGAGTAPVIDPTLVGGALSFTGGAIDASGALIAQGGKLTLEALTGDLNLSGNALLSAAGTRITIGDLIQDTPAGSIRLYADAGNVTLGSGSTVDVSGAGRGYAGSLAVYANKTATLGGTLKGGARYSDLGGTFALIADRLAGAMPLDAGFTRSFQVSLGHGDIAIGAGQTLKSENVLLVANTGDVRIDGTIDASSASGGTIGLYGAGTSTAAAGTANASGVTIGAGAKLYARYQAPDKDSPGYGDGTSTNVQRGGTITLGTTGTPDGTLDPTYGYQNVPGSGAITVASGAIFDVSGGAGGDSIDNMGGSVVVRAPILANRDINVSFKGTILTNAKADGSASGSPLVANAFAVWSTTDASAEPNKHFDGIIDPAGWYNSTGKAVAGNFTNGSGAVVASWDGSTITSFAVPPTISGLDNQGNTTQISYSWNSTTATFTTTTTVTKSPLNGGGTTTTSTQIVGTDNVLAYLFTNDFFKPTTAYSSHPGFYQTTLMNFVDAPFDTDAVAARFAGAKLQVGANAATALPAANLHLRPEIDLVNPSTSINSGNITVASNWNFGAGVYNSATGAFNLFYRTTNGAEPGTLTLRAANNVAVNATISDGFYETSDPFFVAAVASSLANNKPSLALATTLYTAKNLYGTAAYMPGMTSIDAPPTVFPSSYGTLAQNTWYAQYYYYYANTTIGYINVLGRGANSLYITTNASGSGTFDNNPTHYSSYAAYVAAYNTYYVGSRYVTGVAGIANEATQTFSTPASSSNGTTQNLTNFDNNPTHYTSYANYVSAYKTYSSALATYLKTYYGIYNQAPANSSVDPRTYPSTILAPIPPVYGSVYSGGATETASQFTTDYVTNYATGTSSAYYNFIIFYNGNKVEPGNVTGSAASTTGKTALWLAVLPYLPAVSETPAIVVAETANADLGNSIANNPGSNVTTNNIGAAVTIADYNTTSSANLMTAAVSGNGSFSYDFVGGALFNANGASSVNPNAVVQLSSLSSTVTGNVTVNGHTSYTNPYNSRTVNVPTLVRTGTGSITIAAAGDFALLDQVAPGAIYTAGYVADNADGFTAPTLQTTTTAKSGLITTPVWATGGGDITVTAGRDIIGFETPADPTGTQFQLGINAQYSAGSSTGEFWSTWYYVNGKSTGSSNAPFDPSAGGAQYSSWINYGTFFQGFGALGGGDITLKAGRNVKDVSASLPETIQVSGGQSASGAAAAAHYYGGGNLLVEAGNDVLSGVYYVGRGTGLIRAGGDAVADATLYQTYFSSGNPTITNPNDGKTKTQVSVPLLLAVQDSHISVQAAGDITFGGIFQPTRIPADYRRSTDGSLPAKIGAAFDSYGANSGVSLTSSVGSIAVAEPNATFSLTGASYAQDGGAPPGGIVPPNLSLTALTGDIDLASATYAASIYLYPSSTGELSLVAGGSILGRTGSSFGTTTASVAMLDGDGTSALSGPNVMTLPVLGSPLPALTEALHTGDDTPIVIYAGEDIDSGIYTLLKQARVWAGRDILNVTFTGMNTAEDDITSIVAGRDIRAARPPDVLAQSRQAKQSTFTLYGPGDLLIEAGRNLGPFSTYDATTIAAYPGRFGGGIFAVGNGANGSSATNAYLPLEGADITARYGVAGGIDYAGAIAKYGDAATAAASGIDFVSGIIPDLEKLLGDLIVKQAKASGITDPSVTVTLSPSEAADLYTSLTTLAINGKLSALAEKSGLSGLDFNLRPSDFLALIQVKEAIKVQIDHGFLGLLAQVGLDYKDANSPYYGQYARAYEAIATLYPASLGYTDNSAGGSGVTPAIKHTGDLRMARSLVETQTGGDVNILGPGGNLYVGSNSADTLLPSQQGILTLSGGAVRTYNDGSVLLYQSRVFTEQGGNVEMFSANGDLNAGKGPKSSAAYPPLKLVCDANGYCRVNPAGLVTGAGIGALISVPGQDPRKSNVILSAPHGVIDFGAASVRSAGDLSVIAPVVLNSFNAQVGGTATGVPTFQAPDVGGMTQASNTSAGAVSDAAGGAGQQAPSEQPSIIIVEVIGYGGGDSDPDASSVEKNKNEMQQQKNEPSSSSEEEEERKKKKEEKEKKKKEEQKP